MEMEGAHGGGDDRNNFNRPPPPVLLIDGHDVMDSDFHDGVMDLTGRMDDLSTTEFLHLEGQGDSSLVDENFEKIIGAIEEIVVGEEFQGLQNFFLSTYWTKFKLDEGETEITSSNEDEDKHEHFKIFKMYSQEMAHLLENQLKKSFQEEHFDFNQFVEEIGRKAESEHENSTNSLFESEIFEMLFTLTDFVKFKELFTDYKEMMEGKTPNLSTGIVLKSIPTTPRN